MFISSFPLTHHTPFLISPQPISNSPKQQPISSSLSQTNTVFPGVFKRPEIIIPNLLIEYDQGLPTIVTRNTMMDAKTQSVVLPLIGRNVRATRRSSLLLIPVLSSSLLLTRPATAFELRMTVPDQTLEEAETGLQPHAAMLRKVKSLLEAESLKEAQRLLRRSSSLLKQDIYTIILTKPSEKRPSLRRLYSDLFNAVTRLDYAARDEDRVSAWEYYNSIVFYLDDILSQL